MKDLILKQAGMENFIDNNPVNTEVELTEKDMYEQDMESIAGMESYLQGLDLDMASAGVTANDEMGLFVLNQAGEKHYKEIVETFGMEALVDVAERQYYKVKQFILTILRAIVSFVKKMLGMGTNIKKIVQLIKTKAKAYKKKFDKGSGKITLKDDKSYSSQAKSILAGLAILDSVVDVLFLDTTTTLTSASITEEINKKIKQEAEKLINKTKNSTKWKDITSKIATLNREKIDLLLNASITTNVTVSSLDSLLSSAKDKKTESEIADEVKKIESVVSALDFKNNSVKDRKDVIKDVLTDLSSDSIEIGEYRTTIKSLLDEIESKAASLATSKLDTTLKNMDKNLNFIIKNVNAITTFTDKTLEKSINGGFLGDLTSAVNGISQTTNSAIKTWATLCEKGFTETDKFLAL